MSEFPLVPTARAHTVCIFICAACSTLTELLVEPGAVAVNELSPQRDSSGSQLCELCSHRLNRCKGKRHKYRNGLVCQGCYDKEIRPQANKQQQQQHARQQQLMTPAKRALLRDTPLLQTPERISHLQNTVRTSGIGQQGRSRSADENALMLLALNESA